MSVPLPLYLGLSAVLFTVGVAGVLTRRNAIVVFMCIELMLNSVNLTLVAFSAFLNDITGQMLVFLSWLLPPQRRQWGWPSSSRSFGTSRQSILMKSTF